MKSRTATAAFLIGSLSIIFCSAFAQSDEPRQWSDATGRFKILATLVEMRDGNVFLKASDGKTLKIPIDRLCTADQEFLNGGSNPFEEVAGGAPAAPSMSLETASPPSSSAPAQGNTAQGNAPIPWSTPWTIDWEQVESIDRGFDTKWSYTPSGNAELSFEPKRAAIPKKENFFEGLRSLEFNPVAKRAVAGYTVSFSVPKPLSRISIIDLPSGKAINSAPVECDMCPLTVLSDGSTILMHGTGNERDRTETGDQLQLWRLQGRKVARSATWIPFPDDGESFGKRANGKVASATALADNKLVLVSDSRHIACFDAVTRQALWHARLSRNYATEFTTDRSQMFLFDDQTLLVIDPLSGKLLSSLNLEDKPHTAWPRIRISPTGEKLLMTFTNHLRVLDLKSGQFETQLELNELGATQGLSYPHEDYALLDNHFLFHIPSQILVCDYTDAAVITSIGGTEFVGLLGDQGGLVVPTSIPHPKAESILEQASKDPSVFLIHPGVEVSLNVSAVGDAYRAEVEPFLREAATAAGYKVVSNAPIVIVAAITGPEQQAVSYIASGSYIATKYTTTASLDWNGKSIWSRGSNNVPGMIQTQGNETIQQKLDELGKKPNVQFFKNPGFPKLMQAPQGNQTGQNNRNALMTSKFTLQGLIDSK